MEKAGYQFSEETRRYLNNVALYDDTFYTYLEQQGVSPASKEWDEALAQRSEYLHDQAALVGEEAVAALELNEAQPYVRMNDQGYGADSPTWRGISDMATYVVQGLQSVGLSPKGFSEDAINAKAWLYTSIEESRATNPELDAMFEELKFSFPMDNGGWRQGAALYEAVFFGNFNEQYIPLQIAQIGA
jgi:hypothetical protein